MEKTGLDKTGYYLKLDLLKSGFLVSDLFSS